MITEQTLTIAKTTAAELRKRGEPDKAQAIEALVEAANQMTIPTLDLLTTTETGNLFGVTGQTIKNWVRHGRFPGYRVGSRIMIPREVVEEYVRRAGPSLSLEELSDEEAARLVAEERHNE